MAPNVKEQMVAGPLQNVSVAYRNAEYIGDKIFRILDKVDPKTKIAIFSKGAWFRNEAGIRGPGARAKRSGFPVEFVSLNTKEYAFGSEVTDEDRKFSKSQMAPPLQPDQDAIEFASNKIDLHKEILIADMIKSGTWADGNVGGEDAEGFWAPK